MYNNQKVIFCTSRRNVDWLRHTTWRKCHFRDIFLENFFLQPEHIILLMCLIVASQLQRPPHSKIILLLKAIKASATLKCPNSICSILKVSLWCILEQPKETKAIRIEPFAKADGMTHGKNSTGVTLTLTKAVLYWSVPINHDCMTIRHNMQQQHPETKAAKWNSVSIVFEFAVKNKNTGMVYF